MKFFWKKRKAVYRPNIRQYLDVFIVVSKVQQETSSKLQEYIHEIFVKNSQGTREEFLEFLEQEFVDSIPDPANISDEQLERFLVITELVDQIS